MAAPIIQYRCLRRRAGGARHRRHRRADRAALARESGAGLPGGRCHPRAARPGLASEKRARSSTGSPSPTPSTSPASPSSASSFCMFLIGLELSFQRLVTMRRLVFGLGSLQVVLSRGRHRRHRRAVRQRRGGLGDHRRVPRPVVDGHRHRGPVRPAPADDCRRPGELRRPAGAGPGRRAAAAARLASWARATGGSLLAGLALALAHAALAIGLIVIVGRLLLRPLFRLVASQRRDRPVRGGDPVRDRRHRLHRRAGRALHGARRLRRRPAAGRDRVPQGHRDDDRALQGAAARPLLLHGRHGDRHPRAGPRAVLAAGRRWPA